MAQLLFDWLNEDVGLSRKIVAFADDFKDGYMFGELLSKYHQQLNFNQFSAKGTPAAKLNNFCLLEPSMRKIGVHFNSRVVTDIMAGKETITKNLLYEMKTALEGIYRINRQNTNQLLHGTASDQAVAVIKLARPSYEKTISATFSKAIHATIENTNEVLMKEVTQKHTSKEASYLQTMSMADSDAYDAFMDIRYREKEINRNKHIQAEEFAKSWEAQNVAKWKVNQRIAHDRRNLKVKVEHDATVRKSALRTKLQEATRTDTYVGMDAFNDRLDASLLVAGLVSDESELIKTTTNVPGDKTLSLMYIDPHTQKKGLDSAQKKMKEHHEDIAVRTLAHDQRRRKFLREYDTMQMKMSQKIFNTEVIAQMLNFAGSERVEQDLMDKVISYKKIIPDNRRNRQDLMDRMAEADSMRGKEWDAVEAQREVHWTIGGARAAHAHRSEVLKTAVASAERQISTDIALEVMDKLLDVVSWVSTCRQVGVFYYQVTEDPPVFTAPLPETTTETGKKGGKEKEKDKNAAPVEEVHDPNAPKPSSCREGDVVPEDIWADAAKMFRAHSSLATGFQLPAPLLVTDALWPFSLSERPTCVEVDWLFNQPFQGGNVLTIAVPPTSSEGAVSLEGTEATLDAPQLQSLAVGLSGADVEEFVEALNVAEIEVGMSDEASVAVPAPDVTDISTLYTPTWLTAVQPRHFLGETLIAVRSAVDPVPDQPAAVVDTKHIPFRAALCGVSELARKNLTEALQKQIPGLTVIAVSALVDEAVAFHSAKLTPPVDSAVEAGNTAVSANLSTVAEEGSGDALVSESAVAAAVPFEGEVPAAPEPDPFIALAHAVYDCLMSGSPVPDELYVSLIVRVIRQIPERNNGFLLQDFPSTKKQALLLMEAFSGINFDSRRPQPTDKVSPYAPPHPAEEWTYDVALCGLDAIIHVDNGAGIMTAFDERARARTVVSSGETMYIADDQVSIKGLQVIDNTARPFLATGIDLTVADTANTELTEFCRKINLLDQFSILEYSSSEEAVVIKATELCDRYIPAGNLLPGYIPGTELPEEALPMDSAPVEEIPEGFVEFGVLPMEEDTSAAEVAETSAPADGAGAPEDRPASAASVGSATSAENAAVATKPGTPLLNADGSPAVGGLEGTTEDATNAEPAPKEKYVYQMPPVVFQPNAIPKQLADALLSMWNTSEVQSGRKSNAFFASIRDVRYQMLQRRRAAFDGVSCLLVKLDNRQELFDQFRAKFNEVPPDMRFDPDCVAELHLQTLELCDTLLTMSEARKLTAETYTKKISTDAVVTMLQHRCRCESVAMAQSELQRFFVVLHLLFDYCKSVRGYEMRVKLLNELEVTLPVTLPETDAGGKKEKPKEAKKGKEVPGALVPFREPIAAVFVPKASMEAVPEVNGEEVVDPKAKKAPAKEKKGAATENSDPFVEIEQRILEEAQKWRKGTFLVTRDVYEKDEPLCHALEQAIWYEAEKLVLSIGNIKATLQKNLAWLEASEAEMGNIMHDMVVQRYLRELAAINHLVERIEHSIEDAQPVAQFWLVAPDTAAVDPSTVWGDYQHHLPEYMRVKPALETIEEVEEDILLTPELCEDKGVVFASNKELLDKVKRLKTSGKVDKPVPEQSEEPENLPAKSVSAKSSSTKKAERNPACKTTNHLQHRNPVASHPVESAADEQFRREMAIFHAKRLVFEDKVLKKRADREKEFRSMGMSAATAKLAAYNEMLLDEQHDMEDFDTKFKPKRRPISNRRATNASVRRPSSAVKPDSAGNKRPSSSNATMH